MMREYIQHVKRANRTDITLSVACYLSAAVCWFYPMFVDGVKYASVMQFVSLALLVAGIFVNQRYTWTSYIYMIRSVENKNSGEMTGYNLAVHRVQGKRSTCLADIPTTGLISIDECTQKSKVPEKIKNNKEIVRYSFTQTLLPAKFHTAVFSADGGTVAIAFEPDEIIVSMLEECIPDKSDDGIAEAV